jgi:hypothetical protein
VFFVSSPGGSFRFSVRPAFVPVSFEPDACSSPDTPKLLSKHPALRELANAAPRDCRIEQDGMRAPA